MMYLDLSGTSARIALKYYVATTFFSLFQSGLLFELILCV